MTTIISPPSFDIYSTDFEKNRYDIYSALRTDHPVFWHEQTQSWFITRYEDVSKLLVGDAFITSPLIGNKMVNVEASSADKFDEIINVIRTWMIYNDRPTHTRARRHMSRAFWTQELEQIRPEISRIVRARMAQADLSSGQFDFVKTIAHPIPALVLCQMLGIQGADVERFIGWSDDIAAFMQDFVVHPRPDETISAKTSQSITEIHEYLTASIATRRARPQNDLLSRLISAAPSEDGELYDSELINQVIHLIFGGHKIPQFLLSNTLNLLFLHAEVCAGLKDGSTSSGAVVDEATRLEGPIQYITRHASADITVHGETIRANDSVYMMLGAAGRDETVFTDASCFLPEREGPRSLGFGGGYHACIAGAFARMEVIEILNQVLAEVPNAKPLYDITAPEWTNNPTFHGILTMPVKV